MKALVTFSHGSETFNEGDEVNLPDEELDRLVEQGLIGKGKGKKAEPDDAAETISEKKHIEKPGDTKAGKK